MVLEVGNNDISKSTIEQQADTIFSTAEKDLITVLDRPSAVTEKNNGGEFPLVQTIQELEKLYLSFEKEELLTIDTSPQPIKLNDSLEYQLYLTPEGYIALERNGKTYSLEYAKPKLKLPLKATIGKIILSEESFNKELDKALIERNIKDSYVRKCIIKGMELNNVQRVDSKEGTLAWARPIVENTSELTFPNLTANTSQGAFLQKGPGLSPTIHEIRIGKEIFVDIISEIIDQAKDNQKGGTSKAVLSLPHFSTLITYIQKTYPNENIEGAVKESLDSIEIKIGITNSK